MYVIIAGPQAAGKTSALQNLSSVPGITLLQEGRDIVGKRHKSRGAIFMTKQQEEEVIESDLRRMREIVEAGNGRIYVDESNIFTLSHASLHGLYTDSCFLDYCSLLERLNPRIIFLDVPPEISWQRRQENYKERVARMPQNEQEEILREHRLYMGAVYPELLKLYRKIEFPKTRLDASLPLKQSLQKTAHHFLGLMN